MLSRWRWKGNAGMLACLGEITVPDEEVYLGALDTLFPEVPGELFDDDHGAMTAAGAANA